MNEKSFPEWKKKLAEILKEHPDIGDRMTGKVEINLNVGGITDVYVNKRLK